MARLFSSARGGDDGDGSVLSTTSSLSWHTMKMKTGKLFGRRMGGGQVPGTVVKKKGKVKEEPSGLLPSLKEDAEEAEEARDPEPSSADPEPSPLEAQQRILHDEVAELRTSIDMLIQKARPPARELPPAAKKDDAKKSPSPVMFKPPAYGVVHVTLSKPLGLVLEQMRDPRSGRQRGARVRQIPAYGAADMSKMLEVGDELASINGEKMIRLKFRDIMDFIVEEDDEDMELVFRRPLRDGGEEEEEFPSKGISFDKQEKEEEVEHERVVSFQEESTEGQRDIGKSSKKLDVIEEPTQRESRDHRSKRRQGDSASYEETAPSEEAPPEEAPPKEAIPEESLQPEGDIAYEDELHRLYSVSDEEESIALSVQEAMDIDNDLWSRGSDDRRAHDKREKRREKKKSRSERKSKRSSRSAEAEGPAEDRMEKFDDFVESLGLPCCSDTSEFRSQADIYEGQDIVLDEMPQG